MLPETAEDLEGLLNPTLYFINLAVDVEGLVLTGSERVIYTNNEDVELEEIYFRLFPNTPGYGGKMEIKKAMVNDEEPQVAYELGGSAMKVILAEPLAPGEELEIEIDFSVEVPSTTEHGYGLFCYAEEVMAIPNFYPLIPVYDEEGWNVELAPEYGDAVYSDTSLYFVKLTVPCDMVVATSGRIVERADNPDGTATLTYVSGPMRDFNVVMSYEYEVISTTVNGTIVNSYYLPEDEAGGERVLRYASDSLRIYNELFGRYPFSELDVVETPTKAGGIEYPGLIVVADRFYERERGFFELVAAHEVAHQWWYSLVGSDQVDEPWLDEALTNYSTVFYYESVYGKEEGESFIKNYFEEAYRKVVEEGRDMAVAQPVAAFSREDYGPIVYGKGPLFFHSLRGEVGDKVYLAIMQEYLRRHKYGIATPESFLEVAEEVSKRELDSLYEEWLLSPRRSGG
jgi:hypothetical protein